MSGHENSRHFGGKKGKNGGKLQLILVFTGHLISSVPPDLVAEGGEDVGDKAWLAEACRARMVLTAGVCLSSVFSGPGWPAGHIVKTGQTRPA